MPTAGASAVRGITIVRSAPRLCRARAVPRLPRVSIGALRDMPRVLCCGRHSLIVIALSAERKR